MNVIVIVYFSVKSFYPHFRSFETYSCIISYCAAFYLSTFSYDAVRILACPESIPGGALNCKTGELLKNGLTYLNCNAIFVFFGQFTIRCIYYISKRC